MRGKYLKERGCPYCNSYNTSWIQRIERTKLDPKNKYYKHILKTQRCNRQRQFLPWYRYFTDKDISYPVEQLYECNNCKKLFIIVLE